MPQPIRPVATTSADTWTAVGGTHHAALADDADGSYIEAGASASPTLEVTFDVGEVVYPVIGAPSVVVRARKDAAGGNARSVAVQILANGVVATEVVTPDLTEVLTTYTLALPAVVAYVPPTVLTTAVRVVARGQTGGPGGNRRAVRVMSLALGYPDLAYVCDGMGGPAGDHCDYVPGQPGGVCPHLVVNAAANPAQGQRKYQCGLRNELGSWPAVHADPRYQAVPGSIWVETNTPDCGDWFGGTRTMLAAAKAKGQITELDYLAMAQCCFARAKFTADPKGRGQAVGWVNRVTYPGKGG